MRRTPAPTGRPTDYAGLYETIIHISNELAYRGNYVIRTPYTHADMQDLSSAGRHAFHVAFAEVARPSFEFMNLAPGEQYTMSPRQSDFYWANRRELAANLRGIAVNITRRRA